MMAEYELKIDHDRLDELVKIRTRELVKANEELKNNYEHLERTVESIIQVLSLIMEEKDPYTGGHQRRVTILAVAIGEEMGLLDDQIKCLKMAGTVHDLGKITIPMGLLSKPGEIHEYEFKLIEKHPQVAYNILKSIDFSWPVDKVVLQHHERINGTGYPQGLSGNDILPEAKVLAVADVIDAMTFHRPYRPSLGIEMALDEIEKNRDVLYAQDAVDACLRLFREKAYHMES
jgi:HD-GYP domain-containing protein (c-di-GMP phosphodiesterase class II)